MTINEIRTQSRPLPIFETLSEDNNKIEEHNKGLQEDIQSLEDSEQKLFVAGLGYGSKQKQAENHMSVVLEKGTSLNNIYESLEKTKKQQDVIKALSAYKEAQALYV